MSALLLTVAGPDKGRCFPLAPGVLAQLGRGSSTLTKLTDASVSRLHCEIGWEDGRAVVSNVSENGTTVNGESVTRQALRHGDLVSIGNTTLRFMVSEMEEAETIMQPGPVRPG